MQLYEKTRYIVCVFILMYRLENNYLIVASEVNMNSIEFSTF